jgi:hypothetical protein
MTVDKNMYVMLHVLSVISNVIISNVIIGNVTHIKV